MWLRSKEGFSYDLHGTYALRLLWGELLLSFTHPISYTEKDACLRKNGEEREKGHSGTLCSYLGG